MEYSISFWWGWGWLLQPGKFTLCVAGWTLASSPHRAGAVGMGGPPASINTGIFSWSPHAPLWPEPGNAGGPPAGPFPHCTLPSPGATRDIGSALTRMCMRHRSIETKLRQFTK